MTTFGSLTHFGRLPIKTRFIYPVSSLEVESAGVSTITAVSIVTAKIHNN